MAFVAVLGWASVAAAAPSYCTLTGTLLEPSGDPCASCNVTVRVPFVQEVGGDTFPVAQDSYTTDASGNLPSIQVAQTLIVEISIDRSSPIQVQIPAVSSADLSSLVLPPIEIPTSTNINSLGSILQVSKGGTGAAPTDSGQILISGGTTTAAWTAAASSGFLTDVWTCTTGDCSALIAAAGDSLNAELADSTAPLKSGTTAPATCQVGDMFFDTDSSAGGNISLCTAIDTWTTVSGGGGGGSGDITGVYGCSAGDCTDIAAGATDSLDFSAVDANAAGEGLVLPQTTTCSGSGVATGAICYGTTGDTLCVWDGTAYDCQTLGVTDTNAGTVCSGTTTYLDGEGGCDDLAAVYQSLDADLTAVAGLASNGLVTRTGAGTAAVRSVAEGLGIDVTNGGGVSGNPTVALDPSELVDVTFGAGESSNTFAFDLLAGDVSFTATENTFTFNATTLERGLTTICDDGSVCTGYQAGPLTGDVTTSGAAATIAANSVALGTDTTGNYAASSSEAGPATDLACASSPCVANSETTAASANTASAIVARDASGNFSAGTITASLTGTASVAATGDSATSFFSTGELGRTLLPAASADCSASNWVKGVDADFVLDCSQPAFTDISGTIARTQLPDLAYGVDARDYGVVCDGSTDDSQELQDAVDALTTNGGTLVIPNTGSACMIGAETTNDFVELKDNVRIVCAQGAKIKAASADPPLGLFKSTGTGASSVDNWAMIGCHLDLDQVKVSAFYVEEGENGLFQNNFVTWNFDADVPSTNTTAFDMVHIDQEAATTAAQEPTKVIANTIVGSDTDAQDDTCLSVNGGGYFGAFGQSMNVIGNHITYCGGTGIHVTEGGAVVQGNNIGNVEDYGIHIFGNQVNIVGNIVEVDGAEANFHTSGGASNLVVVGNTFTIFGAGPALHLRTTGNTGGLMVANNYAAKGIFLDAYGECSGGSNPGAECEVQADCTGGGTCSSFGTFNHVGIINNILASGERDAITIENATGAILIALNTDVTSTNVEHDSIALVNVDSTVSGGVVIASNNLVPVDAAGGADIDVTCIELDGTLGGFRDVLIQGNMCGGISSAGATVTADNGLVVTGSPTLTNIKVTGNNFAETVTPFTGIGSQAIAAASDTITCHPDIPLRLTTATGTTTMTSNPTVANGSIGDSCTITNVDATGTDCVEFPDGTTGLQLGAARVMCPNDVLTLHYNGTDWVEVSWADN